MKSQVNALLHVAKGILKDASLVYPELKESLSKDIDRLTLLCRNRDQSVFLLDLPHLESLLLRGLETGRLSLEGPFSKAVSSRIRVPKLFAGLWLRIFDKSSCLKHEADVNAIFFLRQVLVLGKRIEVPCSTDRIATKVGEYHDIERSLRRPTFQWGCDELHLATGEDCCSREQQLSSGDRRHNGGDLFDHGRVLHSLSEEISVRVGITRPNDQTSKDRRLPFDLMSVHLAQAMDHRTAFDWSPGSLFHEDGRGLDSDQRKYNFRLLSKIQKVADLIFQRFDHFDADEFSMSVHESGWGVGFKHGPGAVAEPKMEQHEKSCFPNWPHKLQGTFRWETCGKTAGAPLDVPSRNERASRLICVPKTAKGPRLIAAEPTSHQWCQQLILRFLFDQCKKHFGDSFIDFRDQSKSGALVLDASLNRELATVDLSDASDRLTCWTVERIFRTACPIVSALHAARTRYLQDEISEDVSFLSLRKFASQGTATTFPVMSLVMLCIALGSALYDVKDITWNEIWKLRTKVRVFGDDIILPSHGYAHIVHAMDLLQLKVNVAKSYVHGHFRESCGTDGYRGYDITPTKPRTLCADSPASCQAVVDTSNNLFNKGLFYASLAAETLLPSSVRYRLRIVGVNEAGFSGLTSFCGGDERHLIKRWNSCLHRTEVQVWNIRVQTDRAERGGFDALLDFFAKAQSPFNPRAVGEYVSRRRTKARPLWEPQNTCSHSAVCVDPRRRHIRGIKPPLL